MTRIDTFGAKWQSLPKHSQSKIAFIVYFSTLLILSVALYHHYLFGQDLLIFDNSGSDSIGQTIPFILNEADRLYSGDISNWNQYQFLGSITTQFMNPDYFPAVFGSNTVPRMMVVSQLLKIILAGVFFYLFLGYYNLQYKTRFISGLGFALCGRMIELAPWTAYTLEITLLAAMLWGFERFLSNKRHCLAFPIAYGLMGMSEGIYAFVLYGFVVLVYAAFRIAYVWDTSWNRKRIVLFGLEFLLLMLAGVAISLPVTIPSIEMYTTSARISSDLGSSIGFLSFLMPSSLTILAEEIVKLFSNAILGHLGTFTGSTTILDSPYFYFGLLPLISLPFAFSGKTRRQRILLGCIAASAAFYCYSDGFRFVLNGFSTSGGSFRQSSFWVVAVFSLIGALGLNELWKKKSPKSIIAWCSILFAALAASAFLIKDEINGIYLVASGVLLIVYALLLSISSSKHVAAARIAILLVVAMFPMELLIQDYKAINMASHLTTSSYEQQLGSDPEKAVTSATSESEDTYRIDYKTLMLTRSMANSYLGTTAYIGGAAFSQPVNDYLKTIGNDYISQLGFSRYSYGYYDAAVNSLLGVKYVVYQNSDKNQLGLLGYKKIAETDNYVIYEYEYALPLLFGYSKENSMSTNEYESIDHDARSMVMLSTAIVPENEATTNNSEVANHQTDFNDSRIISTSQDTVTKESPGYYPLTSAEDDLIEIEFDLSATATESGNLFININLYDENGSPAKSLSYFTAAGNEHVNLHAERGDENYLFATIEIGSTNMCNDAVVNNVRFSDCSCRYPIKLSEAVSDHMKDQPKVDTYQAGELSGSINMQDDGFLATSIPWNDHWKLYVDGELTPTFPINVGFVGAEISSGFHEIRLCYDPTYLYLGLIASCTTIVALLAISKFRRTEAKSMPKP